MKKLSVSCLLLFALAFLAPSVLAQTSVPSPTPSREAHTVWKNNDLSIFGYHKPYVTVRVFQGDRILGETTTDALGKFEITAKGLDPALPYTLLLKAFDRFGREIMNVIDPATKAVQVQNTLTLTVAPGTVYQGQLQDETSKAPLANATIKVYDAQGRFLTQTQADANGSFAFTGAPKDGYMVIAADGYGLNKQNITGDTMTLSISHTANYVPPVTTPSVTNQAGNAPNSDNNNITIFLILLSMGVVFLAVGVVVWKLKQQEKI